jgi:hypothetical protein
MGVPGCQERIQVAVNETVILLVQMIHQEPGNRWTIESPLSEKGQGACMREVSLLKVFSGLIDVQPNANDHREIRPTTFARPKSQAFESVGILVWSTLGYLHFGLDKNTANFAVANEHVIGPFNPRLLSGSFSDCLAHRNGCPGREQSRPTQERRRKKEDRHKYRLAGWRLPGPAVLSAPRSLFPSQNHPSVIAWIIRPQRRMGIRAG